MAKAYDFGRQSSKDSDSYVLPKTGAEYNAYERAFHNLCDPESPRRIELVREWMVARAFYLSHQWLELSTVSADTRRSVHYTAPDPKKRIPRPVDNITTPIVDNEAAKLYRRKSTAYVRPIALQEGSSGKHTGAAKATDIMEWQIETIRWPRRRRSHILQDVLYGTAFGISYLRQSYLDSIRTGITSALRCYSGCDLLLASPSLPPKDYEQDFGYNPDRAKRTVLIDKESGSTSYKYQATACPKCGGPLSGHFPSDEQMEEGDTFGQPLFANHPKNQPDIEIPEPWEMYAFNEGVGYNDPTEVPCWYRVCPRPTSWIKEFYPRAAKYVEPDDAAEIAKYYPLTGEYAYGSQGALSVGQRNLWRDHVLVFSAYETSPSMDYPNGRWVEIGGGEVLRDEDMFRKAKRRPDVKVPLVKVTASRFFPADGEVFGQGLVTGIRSTQNRINMMISQVTDTRQRHGVDAILATDGMRLTAGWVEGYNGRVVRWGVDPSSPNLEPKPIPSRMIDQGIWEEYKNALGSAQNFAGAQDVDIGKAPRNVSAATAIQLLQEAVAGRREAREQELSDAFKEIYSHQLLLLAEFAVEPRTFRRKTQSGQWEYLEFSGLDLEGHTDVIVEEQAGYDARSFERETVLSAIQAGVVIVQSAYQRREVGKAIGLPSKVMDEENVQISDCEAKWYAFRNHTVVPSIDADLDDHPIMFQTYGRFLKSPEGTEMIEKAGWLTTLPLIAGWDKKLVAARQLDQMVRQLESQAESGQQPQATMAISQLTMMMQQGKPPEMMKLPEAVDAQILQIWAFQGVDIKQPFNKFMALVRAHMLLAEARKASAMVGPRMAAPGGSQTVAGTEPVVGSTPIPGSGAEAAGLPQA